ncbi:MAG: type II toxin-antitoxin system VapC family toxin [Solirubrobacteraceae bacterium]
MIVVDASALVEVVLASPKAATVERETEGKQAHAPNLIAFEVLSAVTGKVRGTALSPQGGIDAMRRFERLEATLELWPLLEGMTERAVALRENVSAYAATYVALAQMMPCPLITADAKLGRAVESLIDVIVV